MPDEPKQILSKPHGPLGASNRNSVIPAEPLEKEYDFIVCGSGSSGSVVARRLSDNPDVTVLLLEAGQDDQSETVSNPIRWPENLGSSRSWVYRSEPDAHLNGRTMQIDAGKTLGGGSSINVMSWVHGHESDWDFFASAAGDPAWGSGSIREIYCRIEDWHGRPDPVFRGSGGPVHVEPARDPSPIVPAFLEAAAACGLPVLPSHNGVMTTGVGGASILESCIGGGRRQSIFRSYLGDVLDRPNLTVATLTRVDRVVFAGDRAVGVEIARSGRTSRIDARRETILSLGAIQTPKVLMQSGIGDRRDLEALGISVVVHSPAVGQNYQDHVAIDVVWESPAPIEPRNSMSEAILFTRSDDALASPDIQAVLAEVPLASEENAKTYKLPSAGWGMFGGNVRPKSRGRLQLTGPSPEDRILIHPEAMVHPEDLEITMCSVELFRDIGNAAPLASFRRHEVMPGPLKGEELRTYLRNAARTFYHQSCTARMGADEEAVVDSELRVRGVRGLRVADASIMPRITTGNTMAPCVVIGERAGEVLARTHGFPDR